MFRVLTEFYAHSIGVGKSNPQADGQQRRAEVLPRINCQHTRIARSHTFGVRAVRNR